MHSATTTIAESETVEVYTERTRLGVDVEVKARKRETVVRWNDDQGKYAGKLELRVAYWRDGIRLPGYSSGDQTAIESALKAMQVQA